MVTRRFEADVPPGTHLGVSHDTDGTYRGHLFDDETNKLVGHVELREVDDDEDSDDEFYVVREEDDSLTASQFLGVVALVGVTIGAVKGVQHYRNRREQSKARHATPAPPPVHANARRVLPPSPEERVLPAPAVSQLPSAQVAVAQPVDATSMSRAEWEERVRAMLLARAFSDEQRRILSHARIVGADAQMLEWQRAFDSLTPRQFSDRITLMLETNPALLTEAEARFLAMFGPGRAPERERVPIQAAHARASASALAAAPAGWYDDTRGSLRWWNGLAWSEHVRTGQGNAAVRTPSATSPGWYADGTGWLRWWDGWQWTGHVAPVEVARSR